MTEQTRRVRVATPEEFLASIPLFINYQPGPGDVAFVVLNDAGHNTVSGNVPYATTNDVAGVADQVAGAVHNSGGTRIFIVGYGAEGQVRAGVLRDAVSGLVEHTNTYAVVDGKGGELEPIGSDVATWVELPDPPVTLMAHLGSAAPSRAAMADGALPLPGQQVPEDASAQAHAALREATGPVSMYADEAMSLLARCGPGSPASTRAAFAALIARDVRVRDAVLVDVMDGDPELRSNLVYAARTAATADAQNLNTLAGTVIVLQGSQAPLAEALLKRGGDLPLARLATMMLGTGLNPAVLRAELATTVAETRTSQIQPASEIEAGRAAARALADSLTPGLPDPAAPTPGRVGPAGPGL